MLRSAASSTRACARLNHWYRPNAVRPGATPLRVTWQDPATHAMLNLAWEDVGALEYRVHQGNLANMRPPRGDGSYDHGRFACGLALPTVVLVLASLISASIGAQRTATGPLLISGATVIGGANWLSVTPNVGSTNPGQTLMIRANPSGLEPGEYHGSIALTPGGVSPSSKRYLARHRPLMRPFASAEREPWK